MAEPLQPISAADWEKLQARSRAAVRRWRFRPWIRLGGRKAVSSSRLSGAIARLASEMDGRFDEAPTRSGEIEGPTEDVDSPPGDVQVPTEEVNCHGKDRVDHAVYDLLMDALSRLEAGDVNEGWASFNAAHRASLAATDCDERLALGISTRAEAASKLTGWRQQAAIEAIKTPDGVVPRVSQLQACQKHLDEHSSNVYRRIDLYASALMFVFFGLVLLLVAVYVVIDNEWVELGDGSVAGETQDEDGAAVDGVTADGVTADGVTADGVTANDLGGDPESADPLGDENPPENEDDEGSRRQSPLKSTTGYMSVLILGALGSLLSVSLTRIKPNSDKVPNAIQGRSVDFFRPVLGAASAVALVLVIESNIQTAISADGNNIYVWALLAGFSERLLRRTLSSLSDSASTAQGPTQPPTDGSGSQLALQESVPER